MRSEQNNKELRLCLSCAFKNKSGNYCKWFLDEPREPWCHKFELIKLFQATA
jgi:hypothetical protein